MKNSSLLALFTALVLPVTLSSTALAEKPEHLFILSGQSNMAGMNPKAGFEPEAKKLFPDAEVVYCKVARGGQPIRLWVSEWNEIADKHKLSTKIKAAGVRGSSFPARHAGSNPHDSESHDHSH